MKSMDMIRLHAFQAVGTAVVHSDNLTGAFRTEGKLIIRLPAEVPVLIQNFHLNLPYIQSIGSRLLLIAGNPERGRLTGWFRGWERGLPPSGKNRR